MPQQIRTALGNRWVGTPQDDAERQNVQAQDAWNSVQHQNMWNNSRFQQGQSDARAMNQDNLNYYGARDAANAAAQAKLAELGFAHDTTMFDKRTGADDARFERGVQLDDARWNTRGGKDALELQNTANQRAADLSGLQYEKLKAEMERAKAANSTTAPGPAFVPTTPREKALAAQMQLEGSSPAAINAAGQAEQVAAAGRKLPGQQADVDMLLGDLVKADAAEERSWYNPAKLWDGKRDTAMEPTTAGVASEAQGALKGLLTAYQAAEGDEQAQDQMRRAVLTAVRRLGVDIRDPDFATTYDKLNSLLQAFKITAAPVPYGQ